MSRQTRTFPKAAVFMSAGALGLLVLYVGISCALGRGILDAAGF